MIRANYIGSLKTCQTETCVEENVSCVDLGLSKLMQ